MKTKKKRKNKLLIILLIVLATIILITAIYFIYKGNPEKDINEANKYTYEYLKCTSECPVYKNNVIINNQTTETLDEGCLNNCMTFYRNQIPEEFLDLEHAKTFGGKLLYNSEKLQICNIVIKLTKSYERFNACLKDVLPKLKAEFNITG